VHCPCFYSLSSSHVCTQKHTHVFLRLDAGDKIRSGDHTTKAILFGSCRSQTVNCHQTHFRVMQVTSVATCQSSKFLTLFSSIHTNTFIHLGCGQYFELTLATFLRIDVMFSLACIARVDIPVLQDVPCMADSRFYSTGYEF
jgi:hypothetical protein